MILVEPNKKTDFLIHPEKLELNKIQLHFAVHQDAECKISPSQFLSALKMTIAQCDIANNQVKYIMEKLDLATFENKQQLVSLLEHKFQLLEINNRSSTPQYVIDGGLRVIVFLMQNSEASDISLVKSINKLLKPLFDEYSKYIIN